MKMRLFLTAAALIAVVGPAAAQGPYDPATRIAAQRAAMARLAYLDGVWRGPAWTLTPQGRREMIQAERIGPFLDGSVRVMEGRGYTADGAIAFNAFGVVSFDPVASRYSLTSWAMGFSGTFPLRLTDDGYVWEAPAGPGATMRYTAVIQGDSWHEIGERIAGDAPPVRIVELNLRRVGATSWPAADPVPMR
ncbi:MAG TPA: DUF1579 domain-containing protein [Allosphingosinicella sp.]|nr:DUF1579 domain-containing protein [Allosphingosinicella sp.]